MTIELLRAISAILLATIVQDVEPASAPWRYETKFDGMTGKTTYEASVARLDGASLLLTCSPEERHVRTYVLAPSHTYLGRGVREFIYRIDERSPVSWQERYGGEGLLIRDRRRNASLAADLRSQGQQIVVRIADYRGGARDLKFSLEHAKASVDQLMVYCL